MNNRVEIEMMEKSQSISSSSNNNNIYDIISYHAKDDEDEEPNHPKDVIKRIHSSAARSSRRRSESNALIRCKLFGCLVIIFLLSAPIYSYGTIYLQQKEKFEWHPALIFPPIIFNSVYLLVTPWLFNSISSTPASRSSSKMSRKSAMVGGPSQHQNVHFINLTNKNIVIAFSLLLAASISVAGFAYTFVDANYMLILIFYSVLGGASSCVIMGKLFVFMHATLNSHKLYLINFIYSLGQALAQTVCPLLLQCIRRYVCHNCALMIIGALMFHIIPIAMMIFETKISIRLKRTRTMSGSGGREASSRALASAEVTNNNIKHDESRLSIASDEEEQQHTYDESEDEFRLDIKYPSDAFDMESNWKNPDSFDENNYKIDNFLENFESHRIYADGVEILQTILEDDDEDGENRFSKKSSRRGGRGEKESDEREAPATNGNARHDECRRHERQNHLRIVYSALTSKLRGLSNRFRQDMYHPLKRSMKICKFYPSVMLKACDIFSYLLFITFILPNLALKQFKFEDEGYIVYLISAMGFAWTSYAIFVLVYHNLLKQSFMHYFHIIGLLGKFFGYLFTNQRYSMNSFIFGIFLISIGHANSFHLQEIMIRNCFHPRKWFHVRGSIYSCSGFLIGAFSLIFQYLYVLVKFVTFCNVFVLFNFFGIFLWLLMHYKSIIYFCSRY